MRSARSAILVFGAAALALPFAACTSVETSEAASSTGGAGTTSGGAASGAFVCDARSSEGRCFEYWEGATQSDVKATCDATVVAGPCPSDQAIGSCVIVGTNAPYVGKELTAIYYAMAGTAWSLGPAKADCEDGGGTFEAR